MYSLTKEIAKTPNSVHIHAMLTDVLLYHSFTSPENDYDCISLLEPYIFPSSHLSFQAINGFTILCKVI